MLLGACLAVALWLLVSAVAALFIAHPLTRPVRLPGGLPTPRELSLRAADGTPLSGWWFAGTDPGRAVVVCHGAFENRLGVVDVVPGLLARGWSVLLFDLRARGRSGGRANTLGLHEPLDLAAALAEARHCGARQLVVLGFSLGAATAILEAGRHPDVAAVIADSPFGTLNSTINLHIRAFTGPLAPVLGAPTRWLGERLMGVDPATVRPLDAAPTLAPRPVLLVHGLGDFMTDPADSVRLAATVGASATLWEVPRARHTKARRVDPAGWWQRVDALLTALPRPPATPPPAPGV